MRRVSKYTTHLDNTFKGGFGTASDLHINYNLIGEWKRANYMLSKFPFLVARAVNIANRKFAQLYRKKVIDNIMNQGAELGWPPLSDKYKAFKKRHADYPADHAYKFFGVMMQNIKTFKHGSMGWAAGIKEGVENERMAHIRKGKGTLTASEYAGVLEFGSPQRNIKPRPLWGPSFTQIGGRDKLMKMVTISIRAQFPSTRLKLPTRIGRASGLKSM